MDTKTISPSVLLILVSILVQACSFNRGNEAANPPAAKVQTSIRLLTEKFPGDSVLVMVYNNDRLRHLDSFCKLSTRTGEVRTASTPGEKIVVVLSGYVADSLDYRECLTYDALRKKTVSLNRDDASNPVQTGTYIGNLENYNYIDICMEPIMSRILIHSIKADFTGRPYEGRSLKNLKLYLVNVNSAASLLGASKPVSIINFNGLHEGDLRDFANPDMLFSYPHVKVDENPCILDTKLYAYPDAGIQGSRSMLVVEATLDGQTYYYPFSINRGIYAGSCEVAGIERGKTYYYDITLHCLGTDSPAREIGPSELTLELVQEPWEVEDSSVSRFIRR